jgi:hypothetical protein
MFRPHGRREAAPQLAPRHRCLLGLTAAILAPVFGPGDSLDRRRPGIPPRHGGGHRPSPTAVTGLVRAPTQEIPQRAELRDPTVCVILEEGIRLLPRPVHLLVSGLDHAQSGCRRAPG